MYPATVDRPAGTSATSIGRYQVLGLLGEGGMGEVLRARDDKLGRDVAIKRVKNVLGAMADSFHARFEAEARALAALQHAGVVQIYDLGADPDGPYLVMELIDGPSLRALLRERGPLPAAQVRSLGIQLARALEAAHVRGILHRDIKPANVLLAPGGVWKLADFGVARMPDSDMTSAGLFIGTPAYAAPEALTQARYSTASDVFGLAATLVEAATGKKPRPDDTLAMLIAKASAPLDLTGVPEELTATLRAALATDAEHRPSAAQLAELLAGGGPDSWGPAPSGPPTRQAPGDAPRGLAMVGPAPATVQLRPGTDASLASAPSPLHAPSGSRIQTAAPASQPAEPTIHVADVTQAPATHGAPRPAVALPAPPAQAAPAWLRRRWVRISLSILAGGLILSIIRCARREPPVPGPAGRWGLPPAAVDPRPAEADYFAMPPGLDGRGQKAWADVAYSVNDGNLRKAFDKLRKFEQRFGASDESARLRQWLEQQDLSVDD